MNIEIADKIAETIEPLLSKAQVIDRINNDEIVKRQDYLSIASGVLAQIREEIKKVENPYNKYHKDEHQKLCLQAFENCRQAILKIMEEK